MCVRLFVRVSACVGMGILAFVRVDVHVGVWGYVGFGVGVGVGVLL